MTRGDDGFFAVDVPGARARPAVLVSTRTRAFARILRRDSSRRDRSGLPRSSIHTRIAWTDHDWRGAPAPHEHVIYEMHIGTFTADGTWRAAEQHLRALADLGVTTLEVMPVAEFCRATSDGATTASTSLRPRISMGRRTTSRHFVDTAHGLGLAVILDVVYNHFGPVGNYLRDFAPTFFGKPGEWGDTINYDGPGSRPGARSFMIENAAYWIGEFHFDGLRFDATQGINDTSPEHVVAEMARAARAAAGAPADLSRRRKRAAGYTAAEGLGGVPGRPRRAVERGLASCRLCGVDRTPPGVFQRLRRRGQRVRLDGASRHSVSGTVVYAGKPTRAADSRSGSAPRRSSPFSRTTTRWPTPVWDGGSSSRSTGRSGARSRRLLLLGPQLPMLFQGQEFASTPALHVFRRSRRRVRRRGAARPARVLCHSSRDWPHPKCAARMSRPGERDGVCRVQAWIATRAPQATRLLGDRIASGSVAAAAMRRRPVESGHPGGRHRKLGARTVRSCWCVMSSPARHRLLVVNLGADHLSPMNDPLFAPVPGTRWSVALEQRATWRRRVGVRTRVLADSRISAAFSRPCRLAWATF